MTTVHKTGDALAVGVTALLTGLLISLSVPAAAAETQSCGSARFDRAEYMKATQSGQKKAEPSVKGTLCFGATDKTVYFLDGHQAPAFTIKYDRIKSLLYERTESPRYAAALLISPLFIFSHSKKHYLTIQYADAAGSGQFVIVHLDKKNANEAVARAESEIGKTVERVEDK
jgi:hypothetical protein